MAGLAERILVGYVEIATFLSFLVHLRAYFLSLIYEFWREDSLIIKDVGLRPIASHLVIDAGAGALSVVFRIFFSQFVKVVMLDGLSCTDSLIGIHFEHLLHQIDFLVIHYWGISCLNCFWMRNLWELQPLIPRVPVEFVLQEVRQWTQNLLDDEELVDFRVSREERLSIHKLAHDAANSPDIDLFAIGEVF